jgi:hypothetical protein
MNVRSRVVRQRLGAVHHGTCRHRGLLVAPRALVRPGLGFQASALFMAIVRADEPFRPTLLEHISRADLVV